MMGGFGAHEYMAPCAGGRERRRAGARLRRQRRGGQRRPAARRAARGAARAASWPRRPGMVTVAGRRRRARRAGGRAAEGLSRWSPSGAGSCSCCVRGDHRVNEIKLQNALGAAFRPAQRGGVRAAHRPGRLHRAGRRRRPDRCSTRPSAPGGYVTGANRPDAHLRGVEPGRDFAFERVDVRTVEAGDTVGGHPIRIEPAIEVGNIFKLGTRYSEPLGATYLDETGTEQLIWMGSYGIGPARIAAAAVEQFADEHGIAWPRSIAPFDVELVGLGKRGHRGARARRAALRRAARDGPRRALRRPRRRPGRRSSPTPSCSACPLRLTVGRRTLEAGRGRGAGAPRARAAAACRSRAPPAAAAELWRSLP